MENKKTDNKTTRIPKIPKSYKKPMTERKYRKLLGSLTDASEKKAMDTYFPANTNGRRQYQPPKDKRTGKKLAGILTKVRKARQGPRTVRIVLLMVVILLPVLFNLFFLDMIATRQLEKLMEKNLETDVDVVGLDISLFKGQIVLEDLSVASRDDPMVDSVALEAIDLDFHTGTLLYRRIKIEKIIGSLNFNRPRDTPAEYPSTSGNHISSNTGSAADDSAADVGLDWMPLGELPGESIELAGMLRETAEEDAEQWMSDVEADRDRIEFLIKETQEFVESPLPDKTDVPAWLKHIEEGKALTEDIQEYRGLVDSYQSRLDSSIAAARDASVEAQIALEADLATLEESLSLDADMVNTWLASAIEAYFGSRIGDIYNRGITLYTRMSGTGVSKRISLRSSDEARGRMKRGRIVFFPVSLPPRFTIVELHLQGEGILVQGSHLGVDHHLSGNPSILNIEIEDIPDLPGSFGLNCSIDGRVDAADFVDGRLIINLPSRAIEANPQDTTGAKIETQVDFTIPDREDVVLEASGRAGLSDWEQGTGAFEFITPETPGLSFGFEGRFAESIESLKINLDRGSLTQWARVLASSFLPTGTGDARAELEKELGMELAGIDSVLDGLLSGEADLASLDSSLGSAETELETLLEDMAGDAGIPLDNPAEAIGGLKSLFGN